MSKKIMIKCEEASTICDKIQYHEASFFERIKLQFHLFLCKKCGLYSGQNKIMSKLFGAYLLKHHSVNMPDEVKEELKEKLEHQMN